MECIIEKKGNAQDINQTVEQNTALYDVQQDQQRIKKKHRRGKPKFKNSNWRFQVPRSKYNSGGCNAGPKQRQRSRAKLIRSNSLAPYNTNRFLMEEHMVEVPLMTPTGRTRDSSICTLDSEDNYFFSLPEDEEDFLTKEFSNVYEKARVERLENLSKEELIQECLQIEDRFSQDHGSQSEITIQRISSEFMSRIRTLEQKIKELSRENYNLRCQVMQVKTNTLPAAASPPSAAAPTPACQPVPMESSSEDTESDSSSTSSSSSSSSSSSNRRRSCSSISSINGNEAYVMAIEAEVSDNNGDDLLKQNDTDAVIINAEANVGDHSENSANSNSCLSPQPIPNKSPQLTSSQANRADSTIQ